MNKIMTNTVTVSFANLHKPDDKFGADSANFNVTIPLTDDIAEELKKAVASSGAKKVNGVYEKDGNKFIKFKNRIAVKDGAQVFPCVDSRNQPTRATAAGGDEVRLLLSPRLISRDGSLSVYLDGVQIIAKNSMFGVGGGAANFDVVDGGYTDDSPPVPEAASFEEPEKSTAAATAEPPIGDDDLPF
jgi:hypothetical protein